MSNNKYLAHSEPLFKTLKLLKIEDVYNNNNNNMLQTTQPTSGGAVTNCCAIYLFLGKRAMRTHWMAGAAPRKSG